MHMIENSRKDKKLCKTRQTRRAFGLIAENPQNQYNKMTQK